MARRFCLWMARLDGEHDEWGGKHKTQTPLSSGSTLDACSHSIFFHNNHAATSTSPTTTMAITISSTALIFVTCLFKVLDTTQRVIGNPPQHRNHCGVACLLSGKVSSVCSCVNFKLLTKKCNTFPQLPLNEIKLSFVIKYYLPIPNTTNLCICN